MIARLKRWAQALREQLLTLWYCRKHPDMPWRARLLAGAVVAYAFSPIDLIPDFIPVIGYLDELILLPLGIYLLLRMIPNHVIAASREKANQWMTRNEARPGSYVAAALVLAIWAALAYWVWITFAGLPADRAPGF